MNRSRYPIPVNELERLEALREYDQLDSGAEQATDDIVEIASHVCNVPIALVVLLDENRQWFKAKKGLTLSETPREDAFCAHTAMTHRTMVVPDAKLDKRFLNNPLVTGDPKIRFYAGAPLIACEGHVLGTLCVINDRPQELTKAQQEVLEALARQVVTHFELRRTSKRMADSLRKIQLLESLLPICGWCKKARDDKGYWSELESYLVKQRGLTLSHGICPACVKAHFPSHPPPTSPARNG